MILPAFVLLLIWPAFFSIAAVALFVSGVIYRQVKLHERRKAEFEQLSHQLNLTYREKDELGLLAQLRHFNLFQNAFGGRRRRSKIEHLVHGRVGDTEVALFDYTYIVQAGNTPKRITQTVFFANNKNWYLPNFQLRPEGWWSKVLHTLGLKNQSKLPESPEFSEKFELNSQFESLLPDVFSTAVQQFLLEQPPAHLEGDNYYFLAYKPRRKLSAEEAAAFFSRSCALVELLQSENRLELLNLAEQTPGEELPPVKLPVKEERKND